jgi:hypothetical protein
MLNSSVKTTVTMSPGAGVIITELVTNGHPAADADHEGMSVVYDHAPEVELASW